MVAHATSFPSRFLTEGKSGCQILKQSVKFCIVLIQNVSYSRPVKPAKPPSSMTFLGGGKRLAQLSSTSWHICTILATNKDTEVDLKAEGHQTSCHKRGHKFRVLRIHCGNCDKLQINDFIITRIKAR